MTNNATLSRCSQLDGSGEYGEIQIYLQQLRAILDLVDIADVFRVIAALLTVHRAGGKVFTMGNGGSASTASHFACDLAKGTRGSGGHFKVISLTDNSALLTAWANDTAYDRIFVEQLENLVEPGDVVVGISASGNSPNVLRAMEFARSQGATTVGFTGFQGGRLKALCDVCAVVPADRLDQIEDTHLALQHLVCHVLRSSLAKGVLTNGELAFSGSERAEAIIN